MSTAGRHLCLLALGVALCLSGRPAEADEAACRAVLDAVIKQATMPVRQKISIESAAAPGRVLQSEIIRTTDKLYMQMQGQWMARPYDGQKAVADARQAMQKAEHTCTRVRSEAVDGQAAVLYSVHSKTASGGTESQIWISSTEGVPLRQHTEMLDHGAAKAQHEVRFYYTDVHAPAGAVSH